MGACEFENTIIGTSVRECYDILVDEALSDSGNDAYNGTISTCNLGNCTLRFDKYLKSNEKKAYDHIENREGGRKWYADYIDLGIVEYELITVKKEKREYNAKYKMKYVVLERETFKYQKAIHSFDTMKEAENKAFELALKNLNKDYEVSKEYVLEEGNNVNFKVVVEKKTYKKEPSLKLKPNQRLIEKHKYIFYGLASC